MPTALTATVRDALLEIGQLRYVDRYARDVKAELLGRKDSANEA